MKHTIPLAPWSYGKIIEGKKKIQPAILDKKAQQVRINDEIEFENIATKEKITCLVNGMVIFEHFNLMIDSLPAELFGYDDALEVKVRIERMFSAEEMENNFAVGFFIAPIVQSIQKVRSANFNFERVPENGRD